MEEGDDRIVIKGVGDITELVKAKLAERRALALINASRRLTLAAKAGRERFHVGDKESGGYVAWMADPFIYHTFGQRWGYDCWNDNDFVRHTLNRIPEMRVVSKSRKPRVAMGGHGLPANGTKELVAAGAGVSGAAAAHGRFRKVYTEKPCAR